MRPSIRERADVGQRLNSALMRAKFHLEQRSFTDDGVPEQAPEPIVVKDRSRVHILPLEEVDYIEAQGDYVAFHVCGRSYLKLQPISLLESTLDSSRFVRVHRSKIVNLERIARITPSTKDYAVTLSDGTRVGMSRSGYARLVQVMEQAVTRSIPASAPLAQVAYSAAGA
jgi:two-component system, LytTR family, response regulator